MAKDSNFELDFCDSAMAAINVPAEDFQKSAVSVLYCHVPST